MIIVRILFLAVGAIAAALATAFLFAVWLIVTFVVLIFMLIAAPFVLFAKNASLSSMQSWITEPFDWAFKTSSKLWTNMFENISRMQ
jgi:hypothetical protein